MAKTISDLVGQIAQAVAESGGKTYFVGGLVRDILLARIQSTPAAADLLISLTRSAQHSDVDLEIHGLTAGQVETVLGRLGSFLVKGKSFPVYGFVGYPNLDIALARREKTTGPGHRDFYVEVAPFIGEEEASRRRDFTINAMMVNALTGELLDCYGGLDDLRQGCLRYVDRNSFSEDPLRVLRAAQLAARLQFKISEDTLDLCRGIDISHLAAERVMGELEKALLLADHPSLFWLVLAEMDHLTYWFKELEALQDIPQNPIYHAEGDAWRHSMMVLDQAGCRRSRVKNPLGFMLSALCHDFGKALTTEVVDGKIRSLRHEKEGLLPVRSFLRRLTGNKQLIRYVLNMVELHMRPNQLASQNSSTKASNKLFDLTLVPEDLVELAICDGLGKIPAVAEGVYSPYLYRRLTFYQETMAAPYVRGTDLIRAGLAPDQNFSLLLAYAHKLRLSGLDKNTQLQQTLAYAKQIKAGG